MNITERLEALLNRANPAFSIADVPTTYGEDVRKAVEMTLNESNMNAYDMVARLDTICCVLAEALKYTLNRDVSAGIYSEPVEETGDGVIFTGPTFELTDEMIQEFYGGE